MKNFIKNILFTAIFLMFGIVAFGQNAKNDSTANLDSIYEQMKEEFVTANFDVEFDFDDDNVSAQQYISGLLGSNVDVYYNQTGFALSPARFRLRGYNNEYQRTYINGIYFNGLERGSFNFSSLGGLNRATRNREITRGIESNSYTFGNIGTSTNYDVRASSFAKGHHVSASLTNRSYIARAQYLYATGLMPNGWAFMGSVVGRWAQEGVVEGTFYKSAGYFLSVEKRFGKNHILNFSTFGAPTERAGQAAVTSEIYNMINGKNPLDVDYNKVDVYDDNDAYLGTRYYQKDKGYFAPIGGWTQTGRYYNPNWGWQNGKKRNSRIVHSYDPTALLNYEWKISDTQNLKLGAAFHYSMYSNSGFTMFNSVDPRPDYYRNLPSYAFDGYFNIDENGNQYLNSKLDPENLLWDKYNEDLGLWQNKNPLVTQINWLQMYIANNSNNIKIAETDMPIETANHILERRHNDLMETAFNANYKNILTEKLKLTAGIEAKYSKGIHYKTMEDLMDAKQWIDIDPFADRDLVGGNLPVNQFKTLLNNIGVDSVINKVGQKFGYDYDINTTRLAAYIQNDWSFRNVELFYALQGTYTQFYRFGRMENGRAVALSEATGENVISKGKGYTKWFIDPAFKAGIVWKINGRNIITANVLAETQAPLAFNSYVSEKIKDTQVKNLVSEKVFTGDIGYNFSFPRVKGRISAFYTEIWDGVERNGYYDDEYRTFINVMMSGINKRHYGVEVGISVKLDKYFTLVAAGTYADYSYTKNAHLTMSAENGSDIIGDGSFGDKEDEAMIKGLKIAAGPQAAGSISLKFFHPKMWFADITINYVDKNYLSFAPSRFSTKNYGTGDENDPDKTRWGLYGTNIIDDYGNLTNIPSAARKILGTQEKLQGGFLLDVSIGKLIYFKDRSALSINLSINNILNTALITGGYQQGRLPLDTKTGELTKNYNKYPNKYYYAYGTNFFLNIGYRF